jgi:hypothetical protein
MKSKLITERKRLFSDVLKTLDYPNFLQEKCQERTGKMLPNQHLKQRGISGRIGKFNIVDRIGGKSVFGEVFKGCNGNNCVAIKKIPFSKHSDYVDIERVLEKYEYPITDDVAAEIKFLTWCNQLLGAGVCPNFPLTFTVFKCSKCLFEKEDRNDNTCAIVLCELAEGTLKDILKSKTYTSMKEHESILFSKIFLFQILVGISVFQRKLQAIHFDLHYNNILYYQTGIKTGYSKYTIDSIDYYLPNNGYIFMLFDFGQSIAGDLIKVNGYQRNHEHKFKNLGFSKYPQVIDYNHIVHCIDDLNSSKDYLKLINKIKSCAKKGLKPASVIEEVFSEYRTKKKTVTDYYNTDKKINIL